MDNLHWEILDEGRIKVVKILSLFKKNFYLAGGTALALQIGHRYSIDFDLFTKNSFSTQVLFNKLNEFFFGNELIKVQEEKDTLTVISDENIKISFFTYPYELVKPLIKSKIISLASIEDIGLMKLSAITGRTAFKDYVDLYWILKNIPLADLIVLSKQKFRNLDTNLVLKSLVYFDDIKEEPIIYKGAGKVSFKKIKSFLKHEVGVYLNK